MTEEEKRQYQQEGRKAWEGGWSRHECPYDGEERAQWQVGYDARQREMESKVEAMKW